MGIARAKGYMQTLGIINRVKRLPVIQEKIVCL